MKFAISVCAAAVLLAGCGGSGKPAASANAAPPAQTVNVTAVETLELHTTVALPAQVLAYETVDIFPKVTGFIESIAVDRGSRVRRGQVIAQLSAPELVAQRSQAEARLQAAESQLAAAQAKLTSDEGTYSHLATAAKTPGVVAGNDVAIAEQAAAADRAQVQAASNNVRAARDNLRAVSALQEYLQVRAPFDGVVTQRNLHPGALVGPASGAGSQPLVQIETLDRLRVVVPVPEAYAAGVSESQQVSFSVAGYPGRTFKAPVARISHSLNQATRSMAVELDLRNADAALTPGAFVTVQWPVQRKYPTMVVPATAITTDLQRTFVIRVHDGKAEWVDVTTGVTANGKTEVFGNLQQGDRVVVNATDALRPGTALTAQGS
jgi:membrane fusion protein, multidrug efflux system